MRERRLDMDAMGIVHHAGYAQYVEYVELARVQCRERLDGLLPRPAVS